MNQFVFSNSTNVVFTYDFIEYIIDKLDDLNVNNLLLLTDEGLSQQQLFKDFYQSLQNLKIPTTLYDKVKSDAQIAVVEEISKLAIANDCQLIIAIGGGSVIDTAKLVNISLTHKDTSIMNYQGINLLESALKPLWVIPTTAGTGSEVSLVAVAKDESSNKKIFFGSHYLSSELAILDPNLLVTLPKFLTAATGLDAVTHAIEAYTASNCNSPITDALCIESLKKLFAYLPTACQDPSNIEARENTLVASTMAGIAFSNSGVGVVHALAHSIGAMFNTHHGATNAVFLIPGIKFNCQEASRFYDTLSVNVFNDKKANHVDLITTIDNLLNTVQLPKSLKSLGVPELSKALLDELATTALVDPSIMFNPVELNLDDLKQIILTAYN